MKFDAETVCVPRYDRSLGRWTLSKFTIFFLPPSPTGGMGSIYTHTYTHKQK